MGKSFSLWQLDKHFNHVSDFLALSTSTHRASLLFYQVFFPFFLAQLSLNNYKIGLGTKDDLCWLCKCLKT